LTFFHEQAVLLLRRAQLAAHVVEGNTMFLEDTPHPFRRIGAFYSNPSSDFFGREKGPGKLPVF